MLTEEHIRSELKVRVDKDGAEKVAHELGFTIRYVQMIADGTSPVSKAIARALGYRRVISFVRVQK